MSRAEFGYDLRHYGSMLKDQIRVDAYRLALEQAVTPGCTVLDIGTGTGFFAIMAVRLGAAKVYALDPNPSILIAKEIAAANQATDHIEFLQLDSTKVDLPQQVDVLVSDLRGVIPLFGEHLNSIQDARERLLRPGGVQIPQRDELFITAIENESLYDRATGASRPVNDVSMAPMLPYLRNTWMTVDAEDIDGEGDLLTSDERWHTIDYLTHTSPNVSGIACLKPNRSGRVHGYLVWFRATVLPGIEYDTRPKSDYQVYGGMFFPIDTPFEVNPEDRIEVDLRASLLSSSYTWRWSTKCLGPDDSVKVVQKQSTFLGAPLSKSDLEKRLAEKTPIKGHLGNATLKVLASMDGQQTVEQVANDLYQTYPSEFPDLDKALGFAGDIVLRYAE